MRKTLIAFNLILFVLAAVLYVGSENAQVEAKESDIQNMQHEIGYKRVDRVVALEKFFEKYNSPLKENAETFVEVADKYGIAYTLLPAISCQESTCAKFLIEGTFNPFGWGIYGNNYIAFESYDAAIQGVGEGLFEGYFSRGLDELHEIAPVYTPPSNGSWYRGVTYFSDQINEIALAL